MIEKRHRGRPRAFNAPAEPNAVQSLDRALSILAIVAEADGLSLSEIAERSRLAPSTAYRMLTTLGNHGMVEFDGPDQLWSIGVETYRMGAAFLRRRKLVDRARIGHAGIDGEDRRDGQSRRRRGRLRGLRQPGRDASGDPRLLPAGHAAARSTRRASARRSLRISAPNASRRSSARPGWKPSPKGRLPTKRSSPRPRQDPARGWSVDDEERYPGMRCVAAAIFNEFGEPIGGISISGPTVRVTPRAAGGDRAGGAATPPPRSPG